jgi:hypothetical protein
LRSSRGVGYPAEFSVSTVLRIEVRRYPEADEAELHCPRPHGRGVVGHDRSRMRFLAATTGTTGDPFVAGPLPFTVKPHAHFTGLPLRKPVRLRFGVPVFGVKDAPVVAVGLVAVSPGSGQYSGDGRDESVDLS